MHRSGTTMITEMLERLGLFVGHEKDDNCESLFFFKLNHWMFKVGISKVDYPQNMLLMNPNCKEELANAVDFHLAHGKKRSYLGNKKLRDIRDLDQPWGWKEPRNTFTLEIYKELFPDARVIHIYRNPLDAAASYLKRDIGRRNQFELTWKKKLKRRFLIADKYHQNFRLKDLDDGFDLWKEYVAQAFSWEETFGDRMKTYKYEDFLDAPAAPLKEMAQFCGLSAPEETIRELVKDVDASRKYAFFSDPASVEFYERIRQDSWMKRLGYDDLDG
jgi:hypothetical protein